MVTGSAARCFFPNSATGMCALSWATVLPNWWLVRCVSIST
jgi:hypothetical protein